MDLEVIFSILQHPEESLRNKISKIIQKYIPESKQKFPNKEKVKYY